MGVGWMLKLCVTLGVFAVCLLTVMTASSTAADQMHSPGRGVPASDAQAPLIWNFLPASGPAGQDDNSDNDDSGDNNNDGGDNSDNSEGGDNDDDDNDDGDDRRGDDNESDYVDPPPIPVSLPPRALTPSCTTPGEETVFTSRDGKAALRVFPTMPTRLRITLTPNYDLLALPPLPGRLAGILIYDVVATQCDGGPPLFELPAEVNLSINYTEDDVFSLDEAIIRFLWLDPTTNSWQLVEKQALNETRNAIGATIVRTGRYVVYEDP